MTIERKCVSNNNKSIAYVVHHRYTMLSPKYCHSINCSAVLMIIQLEFKSVAISYFLIIYKTDCFILKICSN